MAEIILVVSALFAHLSYLFHTTFVDWPEMLTYPWALTKGLVYYRDLLVPYTPGSLYILRALYDLIGYSVRSERIIAYGVIMLTDLLVYLASRTMTGNRWSALGSLLFFVFWQPIYSGNTIWYESLMAPVYLGLSIGVMYYVRKPSFRGSIVLGTIAALASMIKQTAIWPITFTAWFLFWIHKNKRVGLLHALPVIGIPGFINLLAWGYFALLGVGREYFFWVVTYVLGLTRQSSQYAITPSRSDVTLILPSLLPLVAACIFALKHRMTWYTASMAGALAIAGYQRWGLHRLQPMLAFLALGSGLFLVTFSRRMPLRRIVLMGLVVTLTVVGSWRSIRVFTTLRDPMQPTFFGSTYEELVDFVQKYVDGPFFILGNYDYLYFGLDERPRALPWVPLFPWYAKTPGVEEQLIASLEKQEIPFILYIPYHEDRYYLDFRPMELLLYVDTKYEKIRPLPVAGGWVYRRK
ncbi:MAG TPA: hypothetical protein VJB96_00970 [Patescibacteria group bacterium]|nr:hypothetical protein [Patescibacteria group bacterium]